MARCVLPVPIGPAKIRFSGAVTHSPRERVDLRCADAVGRGEVEGIEGLHLREARLAQALADDRLVPRRLLSTEDLV